MLCLFITNMSDTTRDETVIEELNNLKILFHFRC